MGPPIFDKMASVKATIVPRCRHCQGRSGRSDALSMARYQILYWKEIPSVVEAIEKDISVQVSLSPRFQELIDAVAMSEGISESDAYLEHWHKGPVLVCEGTPEEVAEAVAAELEEGFATLRARYLQGPTGSGPAGQ